MKPRRKSVQHESFAQMMIVKYLREALPDVIVAHCPNGGKRSRIEAARFKKMGVLPGMPDLLLYWKGGAGFIEVKREKGGNLSGPQRAMLEAFERMGHKSAVCRTAYEAEMAVREWGLVPIFRAALTRHDLEARDANNI